MSISVNKEKRSVRGLVTYACVTVFCLVFFLIYDRFSHGVRSPYMTFLFGWPLALGLFPSVVWTLFPCLRRQGMWSKNAYHSGVATLTVSSMLRGIFEIAGTASDYQLYLMIAGAAMMIAGIAAYVAKR